MIRNIIFRHAAVFKNWGGLIDLPKTGRGQKLPQPPSTPASLISYDLLISFQTKSIIVYWRWLQLRRNVRIFPYFDFKCQLKLCIYVSAKYWNDVNLNSCFWWCVKDQSFIVKKIRFWLAALSFTWSDLDLQPKVWIL